jgi:PadR family transcriptional regulator, regulatory protein PadR
VLLALTEGRRHGYSIVEEVRSLSEGAVQLKVPTLYSTLDRLEREGLVEADGEEAVDGRLRRYHRLTALGADELRLATEQMEASARAARARLRPLHDGGIAGTVAAHVFGARAGDAGSRAGSPITLRMRDLAVGVSGAVAS